MQIAAVILPTGSFAGVPEVLDFVKGSDSGVEGVVVSYPCMCIAYTYVVAFMGDKQRNAKKNQS